MSIATALTVTASLIWMAGQDHLPRAATPPGTVAGTASGDSAGPAEPAGQVAPVSAAGASGQSEAERIARLRRALETAQREFTAIQATLEAPDGEYALAQAAFQTLDAQLIDRKQALAAARQAVPPLGVAALENEVKALTERWQRAQDRFNLAIAERKNLQTKAGVLQQKMRQDREALEQLTSAPAPAKAPSIEADSATTPAPAASSAAPPEAPPAKGAASPPAAAGAPPTEPNPRPAEPGSPSAPATAAKPPSPERQEAQREAQARKDKAQQAQQKADAVNERVAALRHRGGKEPAGHPDEKNRGCKAKREPPGRGLAAQPGRGPRRARRRAARDRGHE